MLFLTAFYMFHRPVPSCRPVFILHCLGRCFGHYYFSKYQCNALPCVIAAGTDTRCRSGPLVLGTRGSCLAAALGLPQEMPLLSKQGLCLEDVAFTAGRVVVISGEKHSCSMCLGSYCLFSPFLHFKLFYLIRGISSYYSRWSLK